MIIDNAYAYVLRGHEIYIGAAAIVKKLLNRIGQLRAEPAVEEVVKIVDRITRLISELKIDLLCRIAERS